MTSKITLTTPAAIFISAITPNRAIPQISLPPKTGATVDASNNENSAECRFSQPAYPAMFRNFIIFSAH